jgi:uncharacterized protein (TIGR04222 family)
MEWLTWLVVMAGTAAASLVFAVQAPGTAWWVLGMVVLAVLTGPQLAQWWLTRAGRTERLAARWWDAGPEPVEVAFLCGGPDRVVDLVVADLVAEGRLAVDDNGRLAIADPGGEESDGFRREILNRLAHGTTDLAALRFSARSATAMPALWRAAVRRGLMLPAWRRESTPWYAAGAVVTIGYSVGLALGRIGPHGSRVTFWVATAAMALGVVAVWRARFLIGYGFDPRTAAGLRAAELAFLADRADDDRHRIAVRGIRSASDLRAGAADRHRVPISQWHVPWYAKRVPEPGTPWWREVAQAATDYSAVLRAAGGPDAAD